jgi:hypothetical protein
MDPLMRASMRTFMLAMGFACAGVAIPAGAQTTVAFADLGRRLDPGDIVYVATSGGEVTGTVVHIAPEAIEIRTSDRTREFQQSDVRWIYRRGDSVWNGFVIGGGLLGLGFAGGAGASCSPKCGSAVAGGLVGGVAIGGTIGALVDRLHTGRTLVYGPGADEPGVAEHAPPPVVSPTAAAPAVPAAPPASEGVTSASRTVTSLDALWTMVRPGQRLVVDLRDAASVHGRFVRASADGLTVTVNDEDRDIPVGQIRRVARLDNRRQQAVIVGVLAGVGISAATAASGEPAGQVATAPVVCALWGAVIGSALTRSTVVFAASDAAMPTASIPSHRSLVQVRVVPVIATRGTRGVSAFVAW